MAHPKEGIWELMYWPHIAGRGEFVRLVFEEAGVAYKELGDFATLQEYFKQTESTLPGWPCIAPPMLRKGDFQISQTPIICKYLGKEFGMYPDNPLDEVRAEQVNITIHEYLAEGRLCFHGKNFYESYYPQAEETKPYIKVFTETRLPKFLNYFERVLRFNNGGDGFLFGQKLTYVDLGLLHILRATASQFPDEWKAHSEKIPKLSAFKSRMEGRPRLAEYFKSERCRAFEGNSMM